MPHPTAIQITAVGLTDVGRTRSRNEDSFGVRDDVGLALVCDGMGGHAGGDVASRTVAETIIDFIAEFDPSAGATGQSGGLHAADAERTLTEPLGGDRAVQNAMSVVRSAVTLANRRLIALNQARGFPEGRGMGTTVVGLWSVDGAAKAVAFHAGDSRLYRLRDDDFRQLTRDHSLYQIWLDNGAKGPAPQRNIIVRALGTAPEVDADIALVDLRPGDLYLLCSDGLTGMVSDTAIADVLRSEGRRDPSAACSRLVTLANAAGGHDNVTVVLAQAGRR
ncbi:PP2C family protein-serine/threonine phosphatase [Azospirillum sp. A39]|uniref:PP2C family protein-serine/threonine phosphatase n=1 Tax=Azospirillum sp. A39 TaxID=3462279 RepID=UPI0040453D97